jgi:hypothetical protein
LKKKPDKADWEAEMLAKLRQPNPPRVTETFNTLKRDKTFWDYT